VRLNAHFKYFLENTVNLNQSRIDDLDARVDAITSFLEKEPVFGSILNDVIAQGSYAHKTIIKPVDGKEFDADVLLHVDEQPGWEPKAYVNELCTAFKGNGTYTSIARVKKRCVTVDYHDDFHIDVVPYFEVASGSHYITNRETNQLELTDPEAFNAWLLEKNAITKNHLIEVVRLVKYLRDTKGFAIKSVILTTLLGEQINEAKVWADPGFYADMPTALLHAVGDLDEYLQANPTIPWIADPSGTGENFGDRWNQAGYSNFRERVHQYAGSIADAYAEPDEAKSIEGWQNIFGPAFAAPPTTGSSSARLPAVPTTEQWLERDFGIKTIPTSHTLRLSARTQRKKGFRHGELSAQGSRVPKGQKILFKVDRCDVPKPYDVYWKVRNTGAEAAKVGQLRGEIRKDAGSLTHEESTRYRGSHWVECYVVKDSYCVASKKQLVFVK
jgi:hypothetical protein